MGKVGFEMTKGASTVGFSIMVITALFGRTQVRVLLVIAGWLS